MTFSKILLLSGACVMAVGISAQSFAQIAQVETSTTTTTEVNPTTGVTTQTKTYTYDANNNGIIEPNEFATYVTKYYDTDNDGYIEASEWDSYSTRVKAAYDVEMEGYAYWDKDKDDQLDSSELETLVSKTNLYTQWDVDSNGEISASEFAAGTFKAYDDDNDGMINMSEWKDVIM